MTAVVQQQQFEFPSIQQEFCQNFGQQQQFMFNQQENQEQQIKEFIRSMSFELKNLQYNTVQQNQQSQNRQRKQRSLQINLGEYQTLQVQKKVKKIQFQGIPDSDSEEIEYTKKSTRDSEELDKSQQQQKSLDLSEHIQQKPLEFFKNRDKIVTSRQKFEGFQDGINLTHSSYSKQNLIFSTQGNQKPNQDRVSTLVNIQDRQNTHLFTVFDGHGPNGHQVAQHLQENLKQFVEESQDVDSEIDAEEFFLNIFEELHESLQESEIETATSGSTAISVLLNKNSLYCANLGDSRAILGKRDNSNNYYSQELSCDHKPNNFEEEERIEQYGGQVYQKKGECPRVWTENPENGHKVGLAMSRSLGDDLAEEVGVIHEPEVEDIEKLGENDCFIVLGSDGIFEFMENDEICRIVGEYYENNRDAQGACKNLVQTAVQRWEQNGCFVSDDISVTVVFIDPLLQN